MFGSWLSDLRGSAGFALVVAATTAWILVCAAVLSRLGLGTALALPIGDLALLICALVGPVLALWLVAGALGQRREMSDLRRRLADLSSATRQSLQQSEVQVRALLELQHQIKRLQAGDTLRLMLQDYAAQVALLAERLGVIKGEHIDVSWGRYGSGDLNAFVQPFLTYAAQHTDLARRMGEAATRDPVARAALAGAVRRYDQLYAALAADKPARDLLDEGPLGLAYRLFKEADQAAAAPGAPDDDELRRRLTDLAQRLDGAAPK